MSGGMNRVYLLGNLGADPELRTTPGGQAILKLRMATTESYVDKGGQRQERTEWHQVSLWGKRGEALSKLLSKGSRLLVEGSIRTSSYEKDGEKRYRTEVVARDVFLCGGRGDSNSSAPSTGRGPSAAQEQDDFGEVGDDDIPF